MFAGEGAINGLYHRLCGWVQKKLEMFASEIYMSRISTQQQQTFQHLMYLKHWSTFMWIFGLYCFTVDMQALWNKYLCSNSKWCFKQLEHKWNIIKKGSIFMNDVQGVYEFMGWITAKVTLNEIYCLVK